LYRITTSKQLSPIAIGVAKLLRSSIKESLYHKQWVVYSKKSFNNEQSVFEYLGRYTHKIAISNARIKNVTNETVSFEYTDRADDYKNQAKFTH